MVPRKSGPQITFKMHFIMTDSKILQKFPFVAFPFCGTATDHIPAQCESMDDYMQWQKSNSKGKPEIFLLADRKEGAAHWPPEGAPSQGKREKKTPSARSFSPQAARTPSPKWLGPRCSHSSLDVPRFRSCLMFLGCALVVSWLFPRCASFPQLFHVPRMFPSLPLGCSLDQIRCALAVSWLLSWLGCLLDVPWMCLGCLKLKR